MQMYCGKVPKKTSQVAETPAEPPIGQVYRPRYLTDAQRKADDECRKFKEYSPRSPSNKKSIKSTTIKFLGAFGYLTYVRRHITVKTSQKLSEKCRMQLTLLVE